MVRSISDVHEYQKNAIARMLDIPEDATGIAYFLGLGLGKTLVGLGVSGDQQALGMQGKTLVLAPKRVALNGWHTEAANWDFLKGLKFSIVCGTEAQRSKAAEIDADVYVINYENLRWLVRKYYIDWKWDLLIIDESSLVKNSSTTRFAFLKGMCQDRFYKPTRGKRKGELTRVKKKIKHTILLTATPATKGLEGLWSQIYLLDGGKRLGKTLDIFYGRYFKAEGQYGTPHPKYIPLPGAKEEIYKAIEDIAHVLRTEDYLEMPELIYNQVVVDLPPKVRAQYDDLERDFMLNLDEELEIYAASESSLGNKLLQFCNGAVYTGDPQDEDYVKQWSVVHDEKLDALEELAEAAHGSEPLLVAYWYESDLVRLKERFPNAVVMDKEGECIEAWNRGEIDMLLIQPASAGMGLNLQAGGHQLIFFSSIWSLELVLQVIGRIYRQGQEHPVTITNIVVSDSREQRVAKAIAQNATTQEELLEWLAIK